MPTGVVIAAATRATACVTPRSHVTGQRSPAVQPSSAAHRLARRSLPRCHAAAAEPPAAEPVAAEPVAAEPAEAAENSSESDLQRPQLMTDAWNEVVQMKKDQTVVETTVQVANKSGLKVQIGKLTGFLPYKLVDQSRLEQQQDNGASAPPYSQLVGAKVKVKVTQVIVPESRLIVSEKAALLDELAKDAAPGDIIEGRVGALMDWGAFVECRTINGKPCPRAEAVMPMREISYSWLNSASEALSPGQPVRVVVVYRHRPPASKLVVSLKRLEEDPLKETLDNVLPLGKDAGNYDQLSVPATVPQGVDEILEALDREEGVTSITLGRCVEEKRTVSQDLELWITKEMVGDGYGLAVRAGRVVQEVIVSTQMSPEEMRATVQRVLRSIN